MCKNKTPVSHSSTESAIIALDAGLRMDGLLVLDFWDVVIDVLPSSNSTKTPTNPAAGNCSRNCKSKPKQKGKPRCWSIVACAPRHHKRKFFSRRVSVVHLWRQRNSDHNDHWGCRSPTMRHESRTHRVTLDWESLWTHKSKANLLTPKEQLADMLTKGNFARDERDHLLRLLTIMDFSMFSCWHFVSNRESRVSCPRDLRKARPKMVRRWRNRHRWVWCQGTSWAQCNPLRQIRVLRTARGIKSWIRVMFHRAPGNWCETTKTQQHFLKSGDKMTLYLRAPGNWCEVMTANSKGQGWTSTMCKSPTIDTLQKSSRTCAKSWISQKRDQYSTWRPTY